MKFTTPCVIESSAPVHKIYPDNHRLPAIVNDNRLGCGTLTRNLDCLPGYKFDDSPGDDSLENKTIDCCTPLLDVNDSGIDINGETRTIDSPDSENNMVASPLCGHPMTNYNLDKRGVTDKPPLIPKRPFFSKNTNSGKKVPPRRPAELILKPLNDNTNGAHGVSPQEPFETSNKFLKFTKSESCPNKISPSNKDSSVFHLPAVKRSTSGGNNFNQNCVRNGGSDLDRSPLDNRGIAPSSGHGINSQHVSEADIDNMFQKSKPDVLIHNSPKSDRLDLFPLDNNAMSSNINMINPHTAEDGVLLPTIADAARIRNISGNHRATNSEPVDTEDTARLRDVTRNMFGIIKDLNKHDRSKPILIKTESALPNGATRRKTPPQCDNNSAQIDQRPPKPTSNNLQVHHGKGKLTKQTTRPIFHPNRWLIECETGDSDDDKQGTCKIDFANLLNDISSPGSAARNSKGVNSGAAKRISPFTKSSSPHGSKPISPFTKNTSPNDSMDSLERLSIRATNLRVNPSNLKKLKTAKDNLSSFSSGSRDTGGQDDTYHVYETIPGDMDYSDLEKLRRGGFLPKLTSVPNLPGTFIPITPPDLPERGYRQKVEPEMDVRAIEESANDAGFLPVQRKRSLPSIPDDIRSEGSGYAKIDDANDNSHSDPNDNEWFSPSGRRRAFTRNPLNRSLPEPPRSKRSPKRDNLYFLLANKESRNFLSQSLENETKIDNRIAQSCNNNGDSAQCNDISDANKPTRRVKATYV